MVSMTIPSLTLKPSTTPPPPTALTVNNNMNNSINTRPSPTFMVRQGGGGDDCCMDDDCCDNVEVRYSPYATTLDEKRALFLSSIAMMDKLDPLKDMVEGGNGFLDEETRRRLTRPPSISPSSSPPSPPSPVPVRVDEQPGPNCNGDGEDEPLPSPWINGRGHVVEASFQTAGAQENAAIVEGDAFDRDRAVLPPLREEALAPVDEVEKRVRVVGTLTEANRVDVDGVSLV